jgi:hypothetical protein
MGTLRSTVCLSLVWIVTSAPARAEPLVDPSGGPASGGSTAPSAPTAGAQASQEGGRIAVPPARKSGVQGGFKFGAAIPGGSGAKGLDLSEFSGTQFWFDADLGARLGESLFVGGVLGTGFGSPGETLSNVCNSCTSLTLKVGPIARYYFSPSKAFDPWVNLSTGFSLLGVSNDKSASSGERIQGPILVGIEIVKVGVGLDWRFSPYLGVGPYLDIALGTYLGASNVEPFSASVHTWTSLGVRFVLLP